MTDRLRRTCEFHIPSLHTKRTPEAAPSAAERRKAHVTVLHAQEADIANRHAESRLICDIRTKTLTCFVPTRLLLELQARIPSTSIYQ